MTINAEPGKTYVVRGKRLPFDNTSGFAGSGWTAENISDFGDESAKFAGGGGFRYLIARRLGLRVGLDVAVGPNDTVLYMGIGSAWN